MTIANETESIKFTAYPCLGRCISTSITAVMLSFILILCMAQLGVHPAICIIVGAVLLSLNIILEVNFAVKLNSKVTVSESGITQKQYSKHITVAYDSITEVTVKFSPLIKAPPLVTVFSDSGKISFDTTSKIYDAFKEHCKNKNALAMLRKALKSHSIYD